ncbi:MAG: hypothetical protein WC140_07230 [Bacteroidales bacterium]
MNRKVITICTILALVLLSVLAYFIFDLFHQNDKVKEIKQIVNVNSNADPVDGIPNDAISVIELENLSDLKTVRKDEKIFFSFLSDNSAKWDISYSIHYSNRNEVSALYVLSLPKNIDTASLLTKLREDCSGVVRKMYNKHYIYKSVVPRINFSINNGFLIVSRSIALVESSIRQLSADNSLKNEDSFSIYRRNAKGNIHCYVKNAQLGKMFSGTINRRFLKYARFSERICDWTSFYNDDYGDKIEGFLITSAQHKSYINILKNQEADKTDIFEILPFNTSLLINFSLSNPTLLVHHYEEFLQAHNNYVNSDSSKKDFLNLEPKDIALAHVNFDQKRSKVLAIKIGNKNIIREFSDSIHVYPYNNMLKQMLGKSFSFPKESATTKTNSSSKPIIYCTIINDWMLIGTHSVIENLIYDQENEQFFSLKTYLEQTPAENTYDDAAAFKFIIKTSDYQDSISKIFKEEYALKIKSELLKGNFNYLIFDIKDNNGRMNLDGYVYSETLAKLPLPPSFGNNNKEKIEDNTPVIIPHGPYKVYNYKTKKNNYLQETKDGYVKLIDHRNRFISKNKIGNSIAGYISTVDYLKNGKLQWLFAAGSKIWLMDRLGRIVNGFPIDFKKNIVLGPTVIDNGNRNYSILVLHDNNSVSKYNLKGEKCSGWKDIKTQENIIRLPKVKKIGGRIYLILKTKYQTLIYDNNGIVIADFSKNNMISPDSEIKIISNNILKLTTVEGDEVSLNLRTGKIKN